MLKVGLTMAVLLLMSGCATLIGDEPGYADEPGQAQVQDSNKLEQSRNEQLKTEASALREAVRQQQDELQRLQAGSQ